MTLTGKRSPNRDQEWQRTELVQDTKALMVQNTKTGDEDGRPVMETDSHFPACEPALQKERHDMGRAMGCSSVMPQKLGKLILPVTVLSCCRSDMLIQCRHESFCFTICFWPQRSYLTVVKPEVFAECLELISVEGRAIISFPYIRDTMARKDHVQMWNNSFGRGRWVVVGVWHWGRNMTVGWWWRGGGGTGGRT